MVKLILRVKVSWWLRVYLRTLVLLCWMLGAEPNFAKVNHWIAKGIRFETVQG